jgi:hypothetical protein
LLPPPLRRLVVLGTHLMTTSRDCARKVGRDGCA